MPGSHLSRPEASLRPEEAEAAERLAEHMPAGQARGAGHAPCRMDSPGCLRLHTLAGIEGRHRVIVPPDRCVLACEIVAPRGAARPLAAAAA